MPTDPRNDPEVADACGLQLGTPDGVKNFLAATGEIFLKRRDRRAVFSLAYLLITAGIDKRRTAPAPWEPRFNDPAWMARYLVEFADRYRTALLAYATGGSPDPAWMKFLDTETATPADTIVFMDLLMGITAHIGNDLAETLHAVGQGGDSITRRSRKMDHNIVNDVIRGGLERIQAEVARCYSAAMKELDIAAVFLDEILALLAFVSSRTTAWNDALALGGAADPAEEERIRQGIHDRALAAVRSLESIRYWALYPLIKARDDAQGWLDDCFRRAVIEPLEALGFPLLF